MATVRFPLVTLAIPPHIPQTLIGQFKQNPTESGGNNTPGTNQKIDK